MVRRRGIRYPSSFRLRYRDHYWDRFGRARFPFRHRPRSLYTRTQLARYRELVHPRRVVQENSDLYYYMREKVFDRVQLAREYALLKDAS